MTNEIKPTEDFYDLPEDYEPPDPKEYLKSINENDGNGETLFDIDTVEQPDEINLESNVVLLDPSTTGFIRNIRASNVEHVINLTRSFLKIPQIQPVIADQVLVDGEVRYRVIAGQHRTLAMKFANELRAEKGQEPLELHVILYEGTLEQHEILEIQIAENLHNPMTPDEEAAAIFSLWKEFQNVYHDKASKRELARRVGRSYVQVLNAIKFMGINPDVIQMVKDEILPYTIGVNLASIEDHNEQLEIANRVIIYHMNTKTAAEYIQGLINEKNNPGLYDFVAEEVSKESEELDQEEKYRRERIRQRKLDAQLKAQKAKDHRLAIRNSIDWAARNSAGYLKRIIYLLDRMEDEDSATMTGAVADILETNILAAIHFMNELEKHSPELAADIRRRVYDREK